MSLNTSPLLMLGIIALGVLGFALLYVFARVLWLEFFVSGSREDKQEKPRR